MVDTPRCALLLGGRQRSDDVSLAAWDSHRLLSPGVKTHFVVLLSHFDSEQLESVVEEIRAAGQSQGVWLCACKSPWMCSRRRELCILEKGCLLAGISYKWEAGDFAAAGLVV